MRICLVVHGFPPHELSGVENFTAQLARGLSRSGHVVEVFVPRRRPDLADLSLRREDRDGYVIQWFTVNHGPADPAEALEPPGHADHFGRFLDRFQPDVVHFQHVFRVGPSLLGAAAERGLPVVYTGHDYFPVCHRITLLRPDLTRCETIGDPAACARCDLGLALLNDRPELGDYHMGAFVEELPVPLRARLAATLAGEREASGFGEEEWEATIERRRELDGRRAELYAGVQRFLCPTRFLVDRLVEGGVDGRRVVHMPYGIDTDALVDLPRASGDELARRPLRFGFVGSLTKHKGVHVLLDGFERVCGRAELVIHGDSTDTVYVEHIRERAQAVGARLPGAFDQRDLPAILAAIDVLVVPSIWVENYPIAIREAFAAGRPVIASDVGAFPESVRDGVDGLTFGVGDADALGESLERCVDDPSLVAQLRSGIAPVHTLADHVVDHERIYAEAIEARRIEREAAAEEVLPHLRGIAAVHAELSSLPSEELFRRTLSGLDRLAERLGAPAVPTGERIGRALGHGAKTQDLLRDRETESAWLRREVEAFGETEKELIARADWRAEQLTGAQEKLTWLEEQVESIQRENEWLRETVGGLEASALALGSERDWRTEQAETAMSRLAELEQDAEGLQAELGALREIVAHREEQLDAQRIDHERAERERAWRAEEMDRAVEALVGRLQGLLPARVVLRAQLARWRRGLGDAGPPTESGNGTEAGA